MNMIHHYIFIVNVTYAINCLKRFDADTIDCLKRIRGADAIDFIKLIRDVGSKLSSRDSNLAWKLCILLLR